MLLSLHCRLVLCRRAGIRCVLQLLGDMLATCGGVLQLFFVPPIGPCAIPVRNQSFSICLTTLKNYHLEIVYYECTGISRITNISSIHMTYAYA
jgi:hypothetical protein